MPAEYEVLTGHEVHFRAFHAPEMRLKHWHDYRATFWFDNRPDRDVLNAWEGAAFKALRGANLDETVPDSTDEGLAVYLLALTGELCCTEIWLTTDGSRHTRARAAK